METRKGAVLVDLGVWAGRILGLLIVAIALAVGVKVGMDASKDEFWNFLATIVTPMGIGFLILVGAEIVNRLSQRPQ